MWQQIIVYIIGIAVLFVIGRKLYLYFFSKERKTNACIGCNGCKLKEDLLKNYKPKDENVKNKTL